MNVPFALPFFYNLSEDDFNGKFSVYLRCLEIEAYRMKEFVISEAQTEKAVLVGLVTQTQNERKTNE